MPAPASPGAAGHALPVAEVPVGALGPGVVVGGAAVAVPVAEEGGGLGGYRVGRGPVKPDLHPHSHPDADSNSKKAEITLERGVDAKCNYLREV